MHILVWRNLNVDNVGSRILHSQLSLSRPIEHRMSIGGVPRASRSGFVPACTALAIIVLVEEIILRDASKKHSFHDLLLSSPPNEKNVSKFSYKNSSEAKRSRFVNEIIEIHNTKASGHVGTARTESAILVQTNPLQQRPFIIQYGALFWKHWPRKNCWDIDWIKTFHFLCSWQYDFG